MCPCLLLVAIAVGGNAILRLLENARLMALFEKHKVIFDDMTMLSPPPSPSADDPIDATKVQGRYRLIPLLTESLKHHRKRIETNSTVLHSIYSCTCGDLFHVGLVRRRRFSDK